MTFDKNQAFEISCLIRPLKAFHPEILLENDTNSFRRYLTPDAKLLWFYQYCNENGISGKVDTEFVSAETLKDTPYNGEMSGLIKEYWNAKVYLGNEVVGSSMASGTFLVSDQTERDNASNMLRKSAIGAALSQAGFGVITGFNMTAKDSEQLKAEMEAAGIIPPAPAPFAQQTAPAVYAPQSQEQVVQNTFFGDNAVAPNPFANTAPAPAPAAQQTAPAMQQTAPVVQQVPTAPTAQRPDPVPETVPVQADPVFAAKQVVWRGGGRFKGMTLGEVLSEAGGAKYIAWIANEYAPSSEAGQTVKKAAQLILSTLNLGN